MSMKKFVISILIAAFVLAMPLTAYAASDELEMMNMTQINMLSQGEEEEEIGTAEKEERNFSIFNHRLASGEVRNVEVVSVSDYYDKLRHPAAGTLAKTLEEAVHDVQNNAGKLFDPQIVNLFVRMVRAQETSRP